MQAVNLLIALHTHLGYDREAFLCIGKDAITYGNVSLHLKTKEDLANLELAVQTASADAIILSTADPALVRRIGAMGLVGVNIANYVQGHSVLPVVTNDED